MPSGTCFGMVSVAQSSLPGNKRQLPPISPLPDKVRERINFNLSQMGLTLIGCSKLAELIFPKHW